MAKMTVHPAAEIFPMMSEEELDALAADIKETGLQQPIIVDGNQLIDGRNRLEACKRAGVEPVTEPLGQRDPIALIWSNNGPRRHMTKNQLAMVRAEMYPEPEDAKKSGGRRGAAGSRVGKSPTLGVDPSILAKARFVRSNDLELAALVKSGDKPLHVAIEMIERRLAEARSDTAKLNQLREAAPEIAELVSDGKITLAAGLAEIAERDRRDNEAREHARRSAEWLRSELPGHIASVLAGAQIGETGTLTKKAIGRLVKDLEHLGEQL